jgi:uncharacterized protein (DUF1501 family)
MDVWQSADPRRKAVGGWLGRCLDSFPVAQGQIAGMYVGAQALPRALRGSASGVPTIQPGKPYDLDLGPQPAAGNPGFSTPLRRVGRSAGPATARHLARRRELIEELAELAPARNELERFVRHSALRTYATLEDLRKITGANRGGGPPGFRAGGELAGQLALVGQMIAAGFGTRIFYVAIGGFDTHANQLSQHEQLLRQLADAVVAFFDMLKRSGQAERVVLMTFSEFGRRVQENGSRGTDHGAGSCLFVAGPRVAGGLVGEHPSLAAEQLDSGDLRHHTDFRRVYASLLDHWLGCDSKAALGGTFEPLPLIRPS